MNQKDAQDIDEFVTARDAMVEAVRKEIQPFVDRLLRRPWLVVLLGFSTYAAVGYAVYKTVVG